MTTQTYTSQVQPYLTRPLSPDNREDAELLKTATHNFSHWTDELIQMDRQLAALLKQDSKDEDDASAPTTTKRGRGRPKGAKEPKADKPKVKRGRKAKQPQTVAQRHLAKYARSIGKPQSPDNILSMLKALQRDIQDGLIRKIDPNAELIEAVQKRLISLHATALKDGSCVLTTNGLSGIGQFAGLGCPGKSCSCNRSLDGVSRRTPAQRQLAKYRSLQGKVKTAPEIALLIASLQRDIEQGRIGKDDPLAARIRAMQKTLVDIHQIAATEGCVRLDASEEVLNGLDAALKGGCR